MNEKMKKVSDILKMVFGYGIMITLFAGGLTFFGYVAVLIIGGDTAAVICHFLYKQFLPVVIYATTCCIALGLIAMYLGGEKALTPSKRK